MTEQTGLRDGIGNVIGEREKHQQSCSRAHKHRLNLECRGHIAGLVVDQFRRTEPVDLCIVDCVVKLTQSAFGLPNHLPGGNTT